MHRHVCDSASEPRWHRAGTQSLWSAELPVPHQCSAASDSREEVVSVNVGLDGVSVSKDYWIMLQCALETS